MDGGGPAGPDSSDEGGLYPGLPEAASPDAANRDAGTGGVEVLTVADVIRDLRVDSSSVFFLAGGSIRSCSVQGCPGGPSTVQTQVTGNYFALANGLLVFAASQERTTGGRYYDDLTVSVAGNSSLKFVLQSASPGVSIVGFASSSSDAVYSYHPLGANRTFVGRCALPTPQGCTSQSTILSDVEPAQLLPTSSTLFFAGTLGDAGTVGFYAIPITATDGLATSLGFGPVSSRRYYGYGADLYVYTPFSPPQYCSGGAGGCSVLAVPPTIAKCSATGCPGGPIKIATAPPSASEFVVDGSGYYYIDSGKIWSGKGTSAPTEMETGLTAPAMLRVTDQYLFWVETTAAGSQIRRIAKP